MITNEELEKKVLDGVKLSEGELDDLVSEWEIERTAYGDNRRWTRSVESIIEVEGRLFSIDWEQGLTESQENNYPNQPVEVERETIMVEKVYYTPLK